MLTSCTGRSLAVHIALPSATGNASRRNAASCPCEASRANNFLAGRSLAAIFVFCRHARARSARTGNAVKVQPREERSDEVLPDWQIWARPVRDGLG